MHLLVAVGIFVTFIDDYSRFTHVYFIKHKSDVFSVFQEYQALVTNKTGQTIGTLQSDGGGEYCLTNLNNIYALKVFTTN